MTSLEELVAIEQIKKLKSRRDRALDQKDWKTLSSLHAEDHESANDGFESWIGRDTMIERSRTLLDGMSTAHLSHSPDITMDGPDRAAGIWYLEDQLFWTQGDTEHWIHGFGFYHERYVRLHGTWLINYRRLERTLLLATDGATHPAIDGAKQAGVFRPA